MSRAFNDEELDRIRARLKETAHRLFTTQGIRKTSIEELTTAAGIAKSSFYLFYDSKEELCAALLEEMRPAAVERVQSAVEAATGSTARIAALLRATLQQIDEDALTRRLATHPDELETLARRLGPDRLERALAGKADIVVPIIEREQRAGALVDEPAAVVAAVLRAATLMAMHREIIGESLYEDASELMIQVVSDGLTRTGRSR